MRLLINNKYFEKFLFNRLFVNNFKIVILLKSKIALVGLFPINSSASFENLLLIHLFISFINFKGDAISKINLINTNDNNNFYTFNDFIEDNKDKIKNNEFKNITNIDCLEISIYDKYFLKYCIIHFETVFDILTKREDIDLTYTKFINLYIIDINSEQLLFDLNKIQKINNRKYYNDKNLYKEILFHSRQLYQSYIEKYSMRFTKIDSSQRFVKFECTSTYPRLLFVIKFIPVLKGIIIVHIYNKKKLSRITNNNLLSINHENKYKEFDLVFGSFLNENGGMDLKYVMPKKLTEIEKFCEEFFITIRINDMFKLNDPQKEFKYFNYNIIKIINEIPIDIVNNDMQTIFEYINDKIKEKYMEDYEKNKKKVNKKNSTNNGMNTNDDKKITNRNESFEKLLIIDKNIIYNDLFRDNLTLQISEKKNNFSTIKSNRNIINILREPPEKNLTNNYIKKNNNNTQIKEDKSKQSEIKTLNLMEDSYLISKDEDCSNNIMIDNLSLISKIKKNNNSFKMLSKHYKKDNSNLKTLKFQDLLNSSSNKNDFNSIINKKDQSRNIEESESDIINKETNKNLIIKKDSEKKGKTKNRLKMFNNESDDPI